MLTKSQKRKNRNTNFRVHLKAIRKVTAVYYVKNFVKHGAKYWMGNDKEYKVTGQYLL